jgi:transposase InsO family protein
LCFFLFQGGVLRTLGGWIYLTVVLDLFDRKIIG